ncbi:MAG: DUF2877 domain-containing protein [Ornithinibacter sp.]
MPSHRPASRPALPAAVSTLVAALVHGEPVDATVVAAHRYALYLSVRGEVVPVVTADAVALPTAVRLAVESGSVPWGVTAGDVVRVGGGRLTFPALDVVAARTWRPARVRRVAAGAGRAGGHRVDDLSDQLETNSRGSDSDWLARGIRTACGADATVAEIVDGIVGRGPGLTPSGDDALAGALLVTHALGTGTALADAVRARLGATTAVSAALLDAAADGYAARPVVTLVDAAVAGDAAAVTRALPSVLAIGHTSGADTVTGIRAALHSLTPSSALEHTTGGRAA